MRDNLFSACISHFSRDPKVTQSNLHSYLQLRQKTWGRNGFFFFLFFSLPLSVGSSQSRKKYLAKLHCLPGIPLTVEFHTVRHLTARRILKSSLRVHLWPGEPFPLCPPHRRVTCTLTFTSRTEFPEDLLGCPSKESFRDHLLEFASTSSLVYQNFY